MKDDFTALPQMLQQARSEARAFTMARKRLTGWPSVAGAHCVQEPFYESFASEEKCGIVHIKNAQPAIRTLVFVNGLSGTRSRLNTANAANQSMKSIRIIERIAELDPGRGNQKSEGFEFYRIQNAAAMPDHVPLFGLELENREQLASLLKGKGLDPE